MTMIGLGSFWYIETIEKVNSLLAQYISKSILSIASSMRYTEHFVLKLNIM